MAEDGHARAYGRYGSDTARVGLQCLNCTVFKSITEAQPEEPDIRPFWRHQTRACPSFS